MSAVNRKFEGLIRGLRPCQIAVIGDVMLDHYVKGNADRLSPEAPIQVLDVTDEFQMPGGAANVAMKIVGLDSKVRMVGLIGESNNPVSGMTIAALLVIATVLKLMGHTGTQGMTTALMIGSVICIAIAVAGGTSQSLKTTFIIGGNPRANQVGMFVAVSVASIACAGTLMMLHKAYGVGSMAIPAPQATLMKLIVEGIMTGQLPWTLVAIGVSLAVFCYLVDLPILAVAIGQITPPAPAIFSATK